MAAAEDIASNIQPAPVKCTQQEAADTARVVYQKMDTIYTYYIHNTGIHIYIIIIIIYIYILYIYIIIYIIYIYSIFYIYYIIIYLRVGCYPGFHAHEVRSPGNYNMYNHMQGVRVNPHR